MLKPLNNNVILMKEKAETTTASGIVLVAPKETANNEAKVIAVGPKCENELNEGDTVIFKQYSGTDFKVDEDEYIIIEETDILAVKE